jgi:hypothetical protein
LLPAAAPVQDAACMSGCVGAYLMFSQDDWQAR